MTLNFPTPTPAIGFFGWLLGFEYFFQCKIACYSFFKGTEFFPTYVKVAFFGGYVKQVRLMPLFLHQISTVLPIGLCV